MQLSPANNNIFFYLASIFILFPFISPVPVFSDSQPIYTIFLILFAISVKNYQIKRIDFFLFMLLFLALVNVRDPSIVELTTFTKHLGLMIGFLAFMVMQANKFVIPPKVIEISIIIYFLMILAWFFFPNIAFEIQSPFVRNINNSISNGVVDRGIPVFATEGGLAGGVLVSFIVLMDLYKSVFNYRFNILFYLLVLIGIIINGSGTGLMLLLLYLAISVPTLHFSYSKHLLLAVIFFLPLIFLTSFEFDQASRGLTLIMEIVENGNISNILLQDPGIAKRVGDLSLIFYTELWSFFGLGLDRSTQEVGLFLEDLNRSSQIYGREQLNFGFVSSSVWFVITHGIILSMLFLFRVLGNFRLLSFKLIALIYFSVSYSFAFAIAWYIVHLANIEHKKQ